MMAPGADKSSAHLHTTAAEKVAVAEGGRTVWLFCRAQCPLVEWNFKELIVFRSTIHRMSVNEQIRFLMLTVQFVP